MSIRSYFETKLKTYADAHSPVLLLALENTPFSKPEENAYLECYLCPAITMNSTVAGSVTREIGMFQVNVVGRDGYGTKETDDIANAIVALFPILPKEAVSIEQTPHKERGLLNNDGRFTIPVTIKYRYES